MFHLPLGFVRSDMEERKWTGHGHLQSLNMKNQLAGVTGKYKYIFHFVMEGHKNNGHPITGMFILA